jgi:hypothetical protein
MGLSACFAGSGLIRRFSGLEAIVPVRDVNGQNALYRGFRHCPGTGTVAYSDKQYHFGQAVSGSAKCRPLAIRTRLSLDALAHELKLKLAQQRLDRAHNPLASEGFVIHAGSSTLLLSAVAPF